MYKKKLLVALMTLCLVFGIIFALAMIAQSNCEPLLNIGLGYSVVNYIIMIFSTLSILNVLYELSRVN